ncbi:hypothetical protein GLOIN_2v1788142 [Rhizophagus irregularis DAOM 181602=DAOM 197198]|uniref:Integrase zinc-binding domain-containing protein n=1 Tax=Rhizophagus irregularis (strain DAOM 181602 / DAOM 197198 / MUCL 43194) TaxID=747089 RepID=A0A2P4P4D4_RHIID|nr:hypothetical protein GLOIN_2v1788142 [Rhizophagus irregularis DAOM 181602=DAOM 197198]POG60240.1 hypothetical protein GLOIN_2v1788142 [Rhizophagus irregularis DAOM 181602=DAOM 197198]|eukprot:XP_025167106.1 hypothetical protein GLOIN_2v1788142 [Rhizophagus irregularis DAOM 181602=DAOM 197198]
METEEFSFISKDTFNKIIDKFIQNSKSKTSEKQFINRRLYDEIKTVLLDPVSTLRDADFRYWCRKNFILLNTGGDSIVCKNNNKRTKAALDKEGKSADFLPILVLEEMYKTICLEHVQNVHCGQKNLYKKLRSKWYGVKKKIIEEFVNHCELCVPRRTMSKSTLAARPIVAKRFLSRVQLNKDSDIFNEDSDDSNEDSDDFNEDANNFNENSDDFNEDSNNLTEDSDDFNEDSDDFDENSEDFSDLNSNFNKNKNIKKQPKPKRVSNVDSSTLFQLKPPQINNITWEEINASWEGMFGYSNKLRLGVMKRDILACLRDLKVMRETNSFDNILLNIWEKKFNKWLDELDNVQNSETMKLQHLQHHIKKLYHLMIIFAMMQK